MTLGPNDVQFHKTQLKGFKTIIKHVKYMQNETIMYALIFSIRGHSIGTKWVPLKQYSYWWWWQELEKSANWSCNSKRTNYGKLLDNFILKSIIFPLYVLNVKFILAANSYKNCWELHSCRPEEDSYRRWWWEDVWMHARRTSKKRMLSCCWLIRVCQDQGTTASLMIVFIFHLWIIHKFFI